MFSNKRIMTSTENSSDHIKCFHELLQKIDTVIIGAGAGLLLPQVLHTRESDLKIILLTLFRSTDLEICIQAAFPFCQSGRILGILVKICFYKPICGHG